MMQMLLIYLLVGGVFAVSVLVWALSSRQFDEQDRARFLPLRDLCPQELAEPPERKITPSVAMIFVILVCGLTPVVTMLIMLTVNG